MRHLPLELGGLRDVQTPQSPELHALCVLHNLRSLEVNESPLKIKVAFLERQHVSHVSLCVVTTFLSLLPKYYPVYAF